eukprot:m.17581 g.17581  ORF g.17581 m.17581 type:complete len:928 (-) comp7164_c0_seq1:44-2827(-)
MAGLTSAAGLLALLNEQENELKRYALEQLNEVVDLFWAEISDSLVSLEVLSESEDFPHRQLAALLVSKVYYHLGEFDQALTFALVAGERFDPNSKNLFNITILENAIDLYTKQRQSGTEIDARLESIVSGLLSNSLQHGAHKTVLGLAIETRRLDVLERAITEAAHPEEMIAHTVNVAMTVLTDHKFRQEVLQLVLRLLQAKPGEDDSSLCHCCILLDRPEIVLSVLARLISSDQFPVALQLAFDLADRAPQGFVLRLRDELVSLLSRPEGQTLDQSKVQRLISVLGGEVALALGLEFMSRNNNSDLVMLNITREQVGRSTVCHSATILSNAIMHCGTTNDAFLRANRDWMARSSYWAKFSVVASIGVIHKGHLSQAKSVLASFLPKEGAANDSVFGKSGALYALGLIVANHGHAEIDYLATQLSKAEKLADQAAAPTVQHGACLGLGLAAMGTQNEKIFTQLKNILYTDNAVSGEAAGIAMGLVMMGSGNATAVTEMLQYAQDTQHEKIIRGLAVGIALIHLDSQSEADSLIDQLLGDKDALLRMSGCHTIALAYAGSNDNTATCRLLHVAVSDVSDEVRRAAVTAIGFLLFRTPEQIPSVVSLLCESYNLHVRYGACMALGIGCAATGSKDALSLLDALAQDSSSIVRQGAFIAQALVMLQQPNTHPKIDATRKLFQKVIADKHEDMVAKFGAIFAQGILEAGGRNATIALARDHGHMDVPAVAGLMLFTQSWFWFPLGHCLSLALRPAAIICVKSDLKLPQFPIDCAAPASAFAYPPKTDVPKEKAREKLTIATLSTTTRAKARAHKDKKEDDKEKKEEQPAPMAVDGASPAPAAPAAPVPEPTTHTLNNPIRALPEQLPKLSFPATGRYFPVSKGPLRVGVVVVTDTRPTEEETLVEVTALPKEDGEAAPPAPFEFRVELEGE